MSMSALVRALGAAAGGVSKGMDEAEAAADRKRKRQREDEDHAYTMSQRARQTAENERTDKLRTDMGAASMPTTVEAAPVAMPIGSRDEPRAPEDVGIRTAGQTFTDPAAAAQAAADYNTPQATAARQAQVAAAAGDPAQAQQLRTGAMQEQAAKLQLSAGERAEVEARFNADLQAKVSSWETLGKFMSDSAGDGKGGAIKYAMAPSPDGKMMALHRVGEDGALTPTGQAFPNTSDGLALAKGELSKLSPDKMLAHLHQKAVEARQAAQQQSTEAYQTGMLGVAQANQKATEKYHSGMLSVAQSKAAAGAGGMTLADLKDGHKGIASTLNADWKAQIDATTDPADLKAIKVARENEIATVQRLYTGAMSAGFGLTPEQAIVAFRSGTVGTQAFTTKDGKTVSVEGVQYGGRFIPLADNPGAAAAPKKGAAAAPAGASGPAIPVDPNGAKAPPPAKPGMVERATSAVKGVLAEGAETGRQMEAIRARVMEAGKGGTPLSAAERAQAKKFGITPTS